MTAAPPRGFDAAEFRARTARAQTLMAGAGLDAVLLTTEPEVRYFSGLLTPFWQSPTRPWFLIVPAAGGPVAVVPEIGAGAVRATWLPDVRSWPSPRPDDEGVGLLADTLVELCGAQARLGVPMGAETHLRMPLVDYHRLLERLPGWSVADATDVVRRLRMVKSRAEVAKIAHVCGLVSRVFEELPSRLSAGMTERAVFRDFKIACLEAGADDVGYLVGGAGPGGVADIISPPTDRPLARGDLLMLDTGCLFDGYWCDFDRNYALGPPGDPLKRAHAALYAATQAGFDAARPGATCAEVFHAIAAALAAAAGDARAGAAVGRMGHGLGMQLTEWPSITPDDRTELVPGMVLTLEPGLEVGAGRAMVHEENIVITDTGACWLTRRAPADLPVI